MKRWYCNVFLEEGRSQVKALSLPSRNMDDTFRLEFKVHGMVRVVK